MWIIWIFCSSTGLIQKALRENDAWKVGNAGAWKAMEEATKMVRCVLSVCLTLCSITLMLSLKRLKLCHMSIKFFWLQVVPKKIWLPIAKKREILLEAYSPLGTGSIFGNEDVEAVAERNGKSVAQVALRWSLQKGFLPLPKSVTPKNIEANLDIFDFEFVEEDMVSLG